MKRRGRQPITAKGSTPEELAALGDTRLWLSLLQNPIYTTRTCPGCAKTPACPESCLGQWNKQGPRTPFFPAALCASSIASVSSPWRSIHEPLVGNSFISPQGFSPAQAHLGGSKPHHLLQLFLLQPNLVCIDARKELHKAAQKQPLRLFPATPKLFETLHQDLPVLLFLCAPIPCLQLGG